MKYTFLIFFSLLLLKACGVQQKTNSDETLSSHLKIEINTNKTVYKKHKWVHMYVNFINDSNQDVVIIKPKTKYAYQLNFFSVTSKCEKPVITVAPRRDFHLRTEEDLITIKAHTQQELKVSGSLNGVICENEKIQLKVKYDATSLTDWYYKEANTEQIKATKKLYKQLSKIKVESNEITLYSE